MKGIKLCGECANYDWKKHKCRIGCNDDSDPQASFYGDCPLPDVEPVQSWISVDEKLPPKREWVICYSPNKKSLPIFFGRIGNYSDDWQQEGGYICMTHVTHWMPLPESPKGE